jgi:ParB-like chromosome segregation protein Spo0J
MQVLRVFSAQCIRATWTTTKLTSRQRSSLKESLANYGQIIPLVARQSGSDFEIIDGSSRLELLEELGNSVVHICDVGVIGDDQARELHLCLNMDKGKLNADALAMALEAIIDSQPTEAAKAKKEVALLSTLPLKKQGIEKTVQKLRAKGLSVATHNPNAAPGWVDFKFKVDPSAARVCDDALTDIEKQTQCKRSTAFEFICADYLAGIKGQP